MGLQDVFFALRLPFDGDAARALSARISEEIYYWALRTSLELAREKGRIPRSPTRAPRAVSCNSMRGTSRHAIPHAGMNCARK
jgi:ribonucleotide reductase alpha subunit